MNYRFLKAAARQGSVFSSVWATELVMWAESVSGIMEERPLSLYVKKYTQFFLGNVYKTEYTEWIFIYLQ